MQQVTIGSFLLLVSFALLTIAAFSGAGGFLEHPAFLKRHTELHAASIWRIPQLLRLLNLPISDLTLVFQSDFGMPARKPTFFATWRMKSFSRQLEVGRDPCPEHLIQALSGRNADGTFKTAIAKEYPGALCAVIAKTLGDFGGACDGACNVDESEDCDNSTALDFEDLTKPFIVPLTDADIDFGDDFVDTGALPLLKLPNLAHRIVGPDVI